MATVSAPRFVVKVDGNWIQVFTPFILKDTCKSIPGAKWDAGIKAWTYPATTLAAETVNRKLPATIHRDRSFIALLESGREMREQDKYVKGDTGAHLPDPPMQKISAWNHQRQAYWFADTKPATMLAMDMGTGKSKVAIDRLQNDGAKRVLIICPKKVIPVWPAQFARHCVVPYEIYPLDKGSVQVRAEGVKLALARSTSDMQIFVTNYDAVWNDALAHVLMRVEWDYIICDESHRIKSAQGKASKFIGKLGGQARKRIALTGTPMPHSPLDIFAQYRFLDSSIFGNSFHVFKNTYASWGGYGNHQLLGYKNEDDLNARMFSIMYRVDKSVLELPPVQHIERTFMLDGRALNIYRQLESDFITWVNEGKEVTVNNALTKLLRLQQLTGGYLPEDGDAETYEVHTAKRDLLADVLEDIGNEPVVVFARFSDDIRSIHDAAHLAGRPSEEVSGRKNDAGAVWNPGKSNTVLAAQIQAGKEGVDFTAARYCIYYSLGFSLGDYEQSLARVHRPGQTRETFYYHLIAESTVDRKIYDALADRRAVVESILEEWQR